MAARMTEIVKQRGRAYRCTPYGFTSRKARIEEHFYKRHISEHEVPFMCLACEFRTGDNTKFTRHQASAGHAGKVDPVQSIIALKESAIPRFIITGQDLIKLSREESAEHWLSIGLATDDEVTVEDIRPQLLAHEPMVLTPPLNTVAEAAQPKEVILCKDAEVQTEKEPPLPSPMELAVMRIDGNFNQMYNQTSEALQCTISRRIRLDKYEEKERERASASSSTRRDDRRKDDRDSRKEDRGRSRSGHRH